MPPVTEFELKVKDLIVGGLTVKDWLVTLLTPIVPVTVTGVGWVTPKVVGVNVAELVPAAMNTLAGTVTAV